MYPNRLNPPLLAMTLSTSLGSSALDSQGVRPRAGDLDASRRTAIVTAAARVAPAVVSVNVLRRERQVPQDPFAFFFMPRGTERQVEGIGSGFIVSRDGVIITNQHVTDGAQQIVVTMRDGRDFPARLLGEDPQTDIAVLKVDSAGLPTAPLGSSESLLIGEWVVAIGNPYAYLLGNTEPSVTAGVVSAVGRNLLPSQEQAGVYVGMIQTDAAINPGNSGGPLVNASGDVVGVNSNIFSNTGSSIGIGFAIPIERALRVADELRRFGRVRRAWVGLDVAGANQLRGWKQAGGLTRNGPRAWGRGVSGEPATGGHGRGAAARVRPSCGGAGNYRLVRAGRHGRSDVLLCPVTTSGRPRRGHGTRGAIPGYIAALSRCERFIIGSLLGVVGGRPAGRRRPAVALGPGRERTTA